MAGSKVLGVHGKLASSAAAFSARRHDLSLTSLSENHCVLRCTLKTHIAALKLCRPLSAMDRASWATLRVCQVWQAFCSAFMPMRPGRTQGCTIPSLTTMRLDCLCQWMMAKP
jgi:hypothetical protein